MRYLTIILCLLTTNAFAYPVRVIERADGISIVHPADKNNPTKALDKALSIKPYISYKDMDSSELPKDRADRDCWELKNGKVNISNEKKSAKLSKENAKKAIKAKLGITEEEWKLLND